MSLYIANCTMQNFDFHLRHPVGAKPAVITITPATQAMVLYDDHPLTPQSVIDPYVQYGFRDASTIRDDEEFSGLCFSIGAPVPTAAMAYAIDRVTKTGRPPELPAELERA